MKQTPTTITVCLLGDDREREYDVTYYGTADFQGWQREDGSLVGAAPVALVKHQDDREALIAKHPDYGWCSVNNEPCRDFEPELDDARLNAAL